MSLTLAQLREAANLTEEIYRRHAAGCCWHVVLDDNNVQDQFVTSSLEHLDPSHPDCVALGPLLRDMSQTQRLKLARDGYAHLLK